MKILKLNQLNEKLKANQIFLSDLKNISIDEIDKLNMPSITEYYIQNCNITTVTDNYTEGEIVGTEQIRTCDMLELANIKSDTLVGLLEKFVDEFCPGHVFNLNDFAYDSDKPNRIELSINGKFIDDYEYFEEPDAKDWAEFKSGKIDMTVFVFDIRISKHLVVLDLKNEFKKLKLEAF